MPLYPEQLTNDSLLASPNGLVVIALTGILAIGWALGGPVLLLSDAGEPDQYMLGRVGNIDGYNSGILSG